MRLWQIKRKNENSGGLDEANGFVVRARTAHDARKLASEKHGDEGAEFWLSAQHSTCEYLDFQGKSGIILRDFTAG